MPAAVQEVQGQQPVATSDLDTRGASLPLAGLNKTLLNPQPTRAIKNDYKEWCSLGTPSRNN